MSYLRQLSVALVAFACGQGTAREVQKGQLHPSCISQCTLPLRPIAKCSTTESAFSSTPSDSETASDPSGDPTITVEGTLRPGGSISWGPNCAAGQCCGSFEAFPELHANDSAVPFRLAGRVTTAHGLSHRLGCVHPAAKAVAERLERATMMGSVLWFQVHEDEPPEPNADAFCCTIPVTGQRVRARGRRDAEDTLPNRALLLDPEICEL